MTDYSNVMLQEVKVDVPSHRSTLLDGLSQLREKDLLMDVTLAAQGEKFKVGVC